MNIDFKNMSQNQISYFGHIAVFKKILFCLAGRRALMPLFDISSSFIIIIIFGKCIRSNNHVGMNYHYFLTEINKMKKICLCCILRELKHYLTQQIPPDRCCWVFFYQSQWSVLYVCWDFNSSPPGQNGRHFHPHFLEWKFHEFDKYFTEMCFYLGQLIISHHWFR